MMPVGMLMKEHRLIEKVVSVWKKELDNIAKNGSANLCLIELAIDFMKTYADRCHHGKEEDILFRDLKKKPLSSELKKILEELLEEHKIARKTIGDLVAAKSKYSCGEKGSLDVITNSIKLITELYPNHIEKEDKHFFLPCMNYFTQQEQDKMIEEFGEFDQMLIHEKYKLMVEGMKIMQG
jgi:hemerythrin-like domain-containing protein